jgi:hypothetical protein
MNLEEIQLEYNITKRISRNQVIITDGKFIISKSMIEGDTYITYISDIDGPEKVLLNIPEKGYYEIGYSNNNFTVKKVEKPTNEKSTNEKP